MNEWQKVREIDANKNLYDRYWDAEHGSAVVYGKNDTLFGYVNGRLWDVTKPSQGNVQAARIRPEMGEWWLYAYTDPRDGVRAEWKLPVAPL